MKRWDCPDCKAKAGVQAVPDVRLGWSLRCDDCPYVYWIDEAEYHRLMAQEPL